MGETVDRTEEGQTKVYASPRPLNTTTYFSGCGDDVDNAIVGGGNKIIFNMASTDASKSIILKYMEDVWFKDGLVNLIDAPFGAMIDVLILMPDDTEVGAFCRGVPLLGTGCCELDTSDRALVPVGFKIKIVIHNSSGIDGEDAASTFKVAGRIEMYRANTI